MRRKEKSARVCAKNWAVSSRFCWGLAYRGNKSTPTGAREVPLNSERAAGCLAQSDIKTYYRTRKIWSPAPKANELGMNNPASKTQGGPTLPCGSEGKTYHEMPGQKE